jgi:hypothetical protein
VLVVKAEQRFQCDERARQSRVAASWAPLDFLVDRVCLASDLLQQGLLAPVVVLLFRDAVIRVFQFALKLLDCAFLSPESLQHTFLL